MGNAWCIYSKLINRFPLNLYSITFNSTLGFTPCSTHTSQSSQFWCPCASIFKWDFIAVPNRAIRARLMILKDLEDKASSRKFSDGNFFVLSWLFLDITDFFVRIAIWNDKALKVPDNRCIHGLVEQGSLELAKMNIRKPPANALRNGIILLERQYLFAVYSAAKILGIKFASKSILTADVHRQVDRRRPCAHYSAYESSYAPWIENISRKGAPNVRISHQIFLRILARGVRKSRISKPSILYHQTIQFIRRSSSSDKYLFLLP